MIRGLIEAFSRLMAVFRKRKLDEGFDEELAAQAVRKDDIPDTFAFKEKYLSSVETWINPGGSVIVDPDGKIVAGPATEIETILYASFRADELVKPRWQLDIAGHYARPDVFELIVHRQPKAAIRIAEDRPAGETWPDEFPAADPRP
jgi:hypothetical protein